MKDRIRFGDIIFGIGTIIIAIVGIYTVVTASNDTEYKAESLVVEEQKLLTQEDLAKYLGVSKAEATELESEIPSIEIKGKLYFSKAKVDKWLSE